MQGQASEPMTGIENTIITPNVGKVFILMAGMKHVITTPTTNDRPEVFKDHDIPIAFRKST